MCVCVCVRACVRVCVCISIQADIYLSQSSSRQKMIIIREYHYSNIHTQGYANLSLRIT